MKYREPQKNKNGKWVVKSIDGKKTIAGFFSHMEAVSFYNYELEGELNFKKISIESPIPQLNIGNQYNDAVIVDVYAEFDAHGDTIYLLHKDSRMPVYVSLSNGKTGFVGVLCGMDLTFKPSEYL